MDFKEFVDHIRFGVISGAFGVGQVVDYFTNNGWHTSKDVPADRRQQTLKDLTK